MSSKLHIDCDFCNASHPASVELFKWCPTCEKKVCFKCWSTKDIEGPGCPICKKALVKIDDKKMSDLEMKDLLGVLQDNPHPLRGQSLHMFTACLPAMNFSAFRHPQFPKKKGILSRFIELIKSIGN